MDDHRFIRTFTVLGLIFLSTSIAASTTFTHTTADDNIQTTLYVCSSEGETIRTAHLTTQQAQELRTVFDDLKTRVSTAASREETQRLFTEAVIHLDHYGLLPEAMSVTQAQRLVSGICIPKKRTTILQNLPAKTGAGPLQNSLCSIAGNVSNVHFTKLAKRTALRLYNMMDYGSGNVVLVNLATGLWIVCNQFSILSDRLLLQPWRQLGVSIYFGNYHYYPYPEWLQPAQGWIETNGLNGRQNITGSFWGQNMIGGWQAQDDWYMNYTWRGCIGFTGLITYIGVDSAYVIGSALYVNVGPDRP